VTIEYRLDHPLTCGVGKATVFLLSEDADGNDSGVYGVGRNRRERHESMIRRRWCMGVRTCDRISVLYHMSVERPITARSCLTH
jgi:hypothetical protein